MLAFNILPKGLVAKSAQELIMTICLISGMFCNPNEMAANPPNEYPKTTISLESTFSAISPLMAYARQLVKSSTELFTEVQLSPCPGKSTVIVLYSANWSENSPINSFVIPEPGMKNKDFSAFLFPI